MTEAELFTEMAAIMDEEAECKGCAASIKERKDACAQKIRDAFKAAGREQAGTKVEHSGMQVTLKEKYAAKHDPEKFADILKWVVETGNYGMVPKEFNKSRVQEAIDNGEEVPEGLVISRWTEMDFKRTK